MRDWNHYSFKTLWNYDAIINVYNFSNFIE
jgi:hypothetical protein